MSADTILIHRLKSDLQKAALLLEEVNEHWWSSKLNAEIPDQNSARILSWFGGMGSFNDLIISGMNGHRISADEELKLNVVLEGLRRLICEAAQALKNSAR